ncbi:MAG: GNAT family N-acetyltransferase [Clostridia bacterium]|nr:GNAT family N-acetyltransferase [Clostridia bacterium]
MNNQTPLVTLETPRLRIVPLSPDAFEDALRTAQDPFFCAPDTREAMEELWERMRRDRRSRFAWYTNRIIYRKEDGARIGSAAFMNSPQKDPDHIGLVEVGYATLEPFRGMGYMTEALIALRDWAMTQPRVRGLIAGVLDGNPASDRVLEKSGFIRTDHSDALHLTVWKYLPEGRRNMRFWERFL